VLCATLKKLADIEQPGKSAKDRSEFSKLMQVLVPSDTVVVSNRDRLARSTRDLHNILHELREKNCCGFLSLTESWCDTTSQFGRRMMTIMGGINEFEHELIRERCRHRASKAQGTKFARPSALDAASAGVSPPSPFLWESG
jgi:DNA invertase Pin-like site-specific DNA recombinase